MADNRVSAGDDSLSITLDRHAGRWRCRAGGGIWLGRGVNSCKLAEMAQGGCCVRDVQKHEHWGEVVDAELRPDARGEVLRLSHAPVQADGVRWEVRGEWWSEAEDRLRWRCEFRPSAAASRETLLSVPLNLQPGARLSPTSPLLASYCGSAGGRGAYAVFPLGAEAWWPRLEAEKMLFNVSYPMTLWPTRRARGAEAIMLEGVVLAADLTPEELTKLLRRELKAEPSPPQRSLDEVLQAAYQSLLNNTAAAKATGLLAHDEVAFINAANAKEWVCPNVFGAGFSCGFCGHAPLPLLEYADASGDQSALEMARGIAKWLSRHPQTGYGAYHNNYDQAEKRGFDFIGEDLVYPHTTAKIAENVLGAAERFGDREMLASGLKACDWLLSLLDEEMGMPWVRVGLDGGPDGSGAGAVVGAAAISAWVRAHRLTGKQAYLEAAKRLGEIVHVRFVRERHFSGYITDDHPGAGLNRWETPSSTAGSYAVDGYLDLWEHTRDDRWLECALEAAYLQSLWQWLWEPVDRLQVRIKGSCQQGSVWEYTLKQTLGGEQLYMVYNYLRLWEATGDDLWRTAAEMGLFRAEDDQVHDRDDLRYGGLKEGWDLNEDQMIPVTEHGPHVNFLGVSYLLRSIVKHQWLTAG